MNKSGLLNYKTIALAVAIAGLPFLPGCAPYLGQSYTASHNKTMNRPNCPEILSDSAITSFSQDPRRSIELISRNILAHDSSIAGFLHKISPLFAHSNTAAVGLRIHPNGVFSTQVIKFGYKFDSITNVRFVELLNTFRFDSIPLYPLTASFTLWLKNKGNNEIDISLSDSIEYAPFRSKASIMEVVMINLGYLRFAYNWRLRQKSGIKGRITVKFAIDEYGKVIFSKIVGSTVHDQTLESDVVKVIRSWEFCPINKPGDVTEVVYPFDFSQ
jgi:TonB family protein